MWSIKNNSKSEKIYVKMHVLSREIASKIPLLIEFFQNIWGSQTFNIIHLKWQRSSTLENGMMHLQGHKPPKTQGITLLAVGKEFNAVTTN